MIGQYAGWHWIFWFLAIFSAAVFIPLILFMPETCRNVVDDGSIPPPLFSQNLTDVVRHWHRAQQGLTINEAKRAELAKKYKFQLPNPLSTLKVLLDLESAILLVATGLGFGCSSAVMYVFQFVLIAIPYLSPPPSTGASLAFSQNYGFSQLKDGLIYLPAGTGGLISAFTTGRLVDWNYCRWCAKLGIPIFKNRRQDLTNFPIEKARLQVAFPFFLAAGGFLIAYGWILTSKISVVAPVIFLFGAGYSLTACFQILNVLMMDIYPEKASTATAANNFVRCEIGAVFSAILLPIVDAIGWGWAYMLLSLLFVGFSPMLLFVMQRGPKWRRQRTTLENKAGAER